MDITNNLLDKESFYIYYHLIYVFAALIALIIATQLDFSKVRLIKVSKQLSIVLIILLVGIIGLRAYDVGIDTMNYMYTWIMDIESDTSEMVFSLILNFLKSFNDSFSSFLIVIAILFYLLFYKAFYNVSIAFNSNIYLILFSFISFFFATSLAINVIRQGIALALLILGYTIWLKYNFKSKKLQISLLFILSILTHTTSIIPILTMVLLISFGKKINIKWFYALFGLGILLSAVNFGLVNMAPFLKDILGDQRRTSYLGGTSESYTIGFKPQFVIFNTGFLIIFIFLNSFKNNFFNFYKYDLTLKYYILMSFLFFMAFQVPYSDRWGLFSWVFIPVLLAPIFSKNIGYKLKTLTVFFLIFIYTFFTIYASTK